MVVHKNTCQKKKYTKGKSVKNIENRRKDGLSKINVFKKFKNKIIRSKYELLSLLIEIKKKKSYLKCRSAFKSKHFNKFCGHR